VRPIEQDWIERSMDWFQVEFGTQRRHGEVVLPNDDYFPGVYQGTHGDVRAVLARLCKHMDIDPAGVELEHYPDDDPELSAHIPMYTESTGAAGHHRTRDGRSVIGIRDDLARRPMALVATIAHELGHALLLGDGRVSAERDDHEPLTDLLTIFFGLGVFAANAAFEYGREVRGGCTYSQATPYRLPDGTDVRIRVGAVRVAAQ
jgi:hypothetical protein